MAENYCRRGIAYATLQYRVGLFGFGSDGSNDFRGNFALEDIRQALMFLHENAKIIGFDPSKITLAGHSAGASILSALSVSPKSRGKISRLFLYKKHFRSVFSGDTIQWKFAIVDFYGKFGGKRNSKNSQQVKWIYKSPKYQRVFKAICV
jgi:carboxylesterase type B